MTSRESIENRLARGLKVADDPHLQALSLEVLKNDPILFVADWCWTFDPRLPDSYIPFDLYPKQEEALQWLWDLEHDGGVGTWEKSRDTGASWICASYLAHRFLFRNAFTGGVGSRKLEYVDTLGDPKSFFWKIRFTLDWLPKWMIPKEWLLKRSSYDNEARLINPANGATLTGEGGDEIGRGGRTSMYLVDEFGFVEHADSVDTALMANTDALGYISTPNGPGNCFARKVASQGVRKFHFHWKDDPRKNGFRVLDEAGAIVEEGNGYPSVEGKAVYPWRDAKMETYSPVQFAQEYDINYSASLSNIIIRYEWARAAVGLKLPEPAETLETLAGLDISGEGDNHNAQIARRSHKVILIKEWDEPGGDPVRGAYTSVENMKEAKALPAKFLAYDKIAIGAGAQFAFARTPYANQVRAIGVNVGTPASETRYGEMSGREMFHNLKAEIWFRTAERFRRTYEFVEEGIMYEPSELISLPPGDMTEKLIAQLCNVLMFRKTTGKLIVESKLELQKRGVVSPDLAEAFVLMELPDSTKGFSRAAPVSGAVVDVADEAPSGGSRLRM